MGVMTIKCPIPNCGLDLVPNDNPRISAGLRCSASTHSLFYDKKAKCYFVTNKKIFESLKEEKLTVEQVSPGLDIVHITKKGKKGEADFEKYLAKKYPKLFMTNLGSGASADYLLWDPSLKELCFVEVKTSQDEAKLNPRLSNPEALFAKKTIEYGIKYFVAWFGKGSDVPAFYKLDSSLYLKKALFP